MSDRSQAMSWSLRVILLLALVSGCTELLAGCTPEGDRELRTESSHSSQTPSPSLRPSRTPDIDLTWTRQSDSSAVLLVLLHGYGADRSDLLPLTAAIGDAAKMEVDAVALQGPIELGNGRYAWFPMARHGVRYTHEHVDLAVQMVADAIREIRIANPGYQTVLLLGFSQGAMVATEVVLLHPELLDGAVSLSGLAPRTTSLASQDPSQTMPILLLHGDNDTVVPVEEGRRTARALSKAGWPVEYEELPGLGHAIDERSVAKIGEWLRSRFNR